MRTQISQNYNSINRICTNYSLILTSENKRVSSLPSESCNISTLKQEYNAVLVADLN